MSDQQNRAYVPWYILFLMFVVGAQAATQEATELVIEITSGIDQQTSIAIVPFQWQGSGLLPVNVNTIVNADLYRSGLFKPLDAAAMLSRPSVETEILFREWRALEVDYLVIGSLAPSNDQALSYQFALYDVVRERLLFTEKGVGGNIRDISHHVSDQVYEKITGVRGAFSTQILYVSVERKGLDQIYKLKRADSDGHRMVTLFQSDEPILSPTWSPDAKQIAYVSYHKGRKPGIYLHDITTGQQQQLTYFKGINGAPAWSPDGRYMALVLSKDGNPEIYLLEIANKNLVRLTDHHAIDTEPTWMPHGKSLIFTSDRGGGPQLYELGLQDGSLRRLTFQGSYNAKGVLSADGRFLGMVHRSQGRFHIAVKDLLRGTFHVLTETSLDETPSLAPNASMVIYATRYRGKGILSAVSLDGQVKVRLPARIGEVREPAWSPYLKQP